MKASNPSPVTEAPIAASFTQNWDPFKPECSGQCVKTVVCPCGSVQTNFKAIGEDRLAEQFFMKIGLLVVFIYAWYLCIELYDPYYFYWHYRIPKASLMIPRYVALCVLVWLLIEQRRELGSKMRIENPTRFNFGIPVDLVYYCLPMWVLCQEANTATRFEVYKKSKAMVGGGNNPMNQIGMVGGNSQMYQMNNMQGNGQMYQMNNMQGNGQMYQMNNMQGNGQMYQPQMNNMQGNGQMNNMQGNGQMNNMQGQSQMYQPQMNNTQMMYQPQMNNTQMMYQPQMNNTQMMYQPQMNNTQMMFQPQINSQPSQNQFNGQLMYQPQGQNQQTYGNIQQTYGNSQQTYGNSQSNGLDTGNQMGNGDGTLPNTENVSTVGVPVRA